MMRITSLSNNIVKEIAKLSDKKYRNLNGEFLVEGYHLVDEANKAGLLKTVIITKEEDYIEGIENIYVSKDVLNKIANTVTPQGIVGICDIIDNKVNGNKFLILENITDPGNMGTLIRSALGFNIDTVIVSTGCVDIYNDKVIRGTQGALFNINIVVSDLVESIKVLKESGVTIIGTSLKSSIDLKSLKKLDKYAIVLGNEANGISDEILNLCDVNVTIKTSSKLESLNVAIAGSIIMNHLM